MTRTIASLPAALAAFALMPSASRSCSCEPVSLEDRFAAADVVFVATIMESKIEAPAQEGTPNGIGRYVKVTGKFRVDEKLKGETSNVQILETRLYLPDPGVREIIVSSCDVGAFVPGEQWVVFATSEGGVEVSGCSPTRRIRDSRDLDQLKALGVLQRRSAHRTAPNKAIHATCEDARA